MALFILETLHLPVPAFQSINSSLSSTEKVNDCHVEKGSYFLITFRKFVKIMFYKLQESI